MLSRAIVLIVLAALGFWLWTVFFPRPEKIIRKQLARLANDASFSANENDIIKMADAQNIPDFFSTNVLINITIPGREQQTLAGRDEIRAAALASRAQATALDLKFPDIVITVAPDKNSAVADVTVNATVSGEHDAVVQELKFNFQKTSGEWLINKVETVQKVSL